MSYTYIDSFIFPEWRNLSIFVSINSWLNSMLERLNSQFICFINYSISYCGFSYAILHIFSVIYKDFSWIEILHGPIESAIEYRTLSWNVQKKCGDLRKNTRKRINCENHEKMPIFRILQIIQLRLCVEFHVYH